MVDRHVVVEELLAAGAPVSAHWFAERQIGPSLLRNGTEAQRRKFLPPIAAGDCYFAVGMSEPDSGSDLASVRTRAVPCIGGWTVDGAKIWTTGAAIAHYVLTLCRSSLSESGTPHEGLSQLIIPIDSPGVTVKPIASMASEPELNEIMFDNVLVPVEGLVGREGDGWKQVMMELADERGGPERYLSMFGVLRELGYAASDTGSTEPTRVLGSAVSRLWSVRALGYTHLLRPAGSSKERAVVAALVKDVGTSYERQLLEDARVALAPTDSGLRSAPALRSAIRHSPAVTLRGGATEVLRDIMWRETTTGNVEWQIK
jgi:hypothetical protein